MQWTLGKKLGLGFGAVLALMLSLGILSLGKLSQMNRAAADPGTNWLPSVQVLGQLRFDASMTRRWELNYIVMPDKAKARHRFEEGLAAVQADGKTYEPLIASDEEERLYQEFRAAWERHLAVAGRLLALEDQGLHKEAIALNDGEGFDSFGVADQKVAADFSFNDQGGIDSYRSAQATYRSGRYAVIGLVLAASLAGALVATLLTRSPGQAAAGMLATIERMAANDLTVADLEISSGDEIGQTGRALNGLKNSFRDLTGSIAGTAAKVTQASEQLSSTSQLITANSEETSVQAKVVSDATLEGISNTIATAVKEQNATTNEMSRNVSEAARSSGEITSNIVGVAQAAESTSPGAGDTQKAAQELVETSGQLRSLGGTVPRSRHGRRRARADPGSARLDRVRERRGRSA